MQINTSEGLKSPGEALEIFKRAKLPADSLLGIYGQLIQTERGAEATAYIGRNSRLFSEDIIEIASQQKNGRPSGTKQGTPKDEVLRTIRSRVRPTVTITFRQDSARYIRQVTSLSPRHIRFHDSSAAMLLNRIVGVSGEWQGIPRTYTVTLNTSDEREIDRLASILEALIE